MYELVPIHELVIFGNNPKAGIEEAEQLKKTKIPKSYDKIRKNRLLLDENTTFN